MISFKSVKLLMTTWLRTQCYKMLIWISRIVFEKWDLHPKFGKIAPESLLRQHGKQGGKLRKPAPPGSPGMSQTCSPPHTHTLFQLNKVSLCSLGWLRSHYATQAGFEPIVILLAQLLTPPRDKRATQWTASGKTWARGHVSSNRFLWKCTGV